jgi:hypothetical protein
LLCDRGYFLAKPLLNSLPLAQKFQPHTRKMDYIPWKTSITASRLRQIIRYVGFVRH